MMKHNLYDSGSVRKVIERQGVFEVLEHTRNLSVTPDTAMQSYFSATMGCCQRQLIANLNGEKGVITQAGAMQYMLGNLQMVSNVQGAGDLVKKMFQGKVTGESCIKPRYTGQGTLILEPTYKHLFLINVSDWGGVVVEDGMFLAAEDSLNLTVKTHSLSRTLLGNEGMFNLCFTGNGVLACESNTAYKELLLLELNNDVVKIDGSYAVAWSSSLDFTVERSSKSLAGSAVSGEGLVNVYRGTGKILTALV